MNQQAERDQQRLRAFLLREFALDPDGTPVDMAMRLLERLKRDEGRLLACIEARRPALSAALAGEIQFETPTNAAVRLLTHFLGDPAPTGS